MTNVTQKVEHGVRSQQFNLFMARLKGNNVLYLRNMQEAFTHLLCMN